MRRFCDYQKGDTFWWRGKTYMKIDGEAYPTTVGEVYRSLIHKNQWLCEY